MVKTGQVWTGSFVTKDATGALSTPSVGPAGTLRVAGVATGDVVTISGSNPYKFSVTLPALTAGESVDMYVTATISGIATAAIVATEMADTSYLSDVAVLVDQVEGYTDSLEASATSLAAAIAALDDLSSAQVQAAAAAALAAYDPPTQAEMDTAIASILTEGGAGPWGAAGTNPNLVRSGTAQAGAASSITLDSGASSVNSYYRGSLIHITGGTGAGQARIIIGYVGSTKVATVDTAWATNPDNTSTFAILADLGPLLLDKLALIGAGYLFGAVSPVSSKGPVETVQGIDYTTTHGDLRLLWVKPAAASWPTDLTGHTITAKITVPVTQAVPSGSLTFTGAVVVATGDSRQVAVALSAANTTSIPVNEGSGWEYALYSTKDSETHLLAKSRWVSRQLP